MHVVATAGHVDHGKSSLVRALTGIDPDRWAEEKERGLTIDLGFAWAELPSGRGVSFVDVPGHVRFIRNMLAGVGAVDACVFVVAATEGWKPQSEEHLRILEMVDLRHGLVALTKVDVAEPDLTELAALEIAEHVEGTFLEDAPVVPVDSLSGRGLGRPARRPRRRAGRHPSGPRPGQAPAVDRPGLRREGQRHGGHRHPHRRLARRRGRGDRGAGRPPGPRPGHPEPHARGARPSAPATGSR